MKSELTTSELAIKIHEDDVEAFNALYWKYHADLYANILKLTRNSSAAEDILQEVFIQLWEKRKTIDPERSVAGWLFTVSHNMSVNYLRKKLKESLAYSQLKQPVEAVETNEDLAGIELRALQTAIRQLSPQKRKVFELCKIDGKTYEEAARELQISKYTVKEYLSGAVYSIKDYLQNNSPRQVTYCLIVCISVFLS
jgi:RNA polymerase sigma-70 factor (family 1)